MNLIKKTYRPIQALRVSVLVAGLGLTLGCSMERAKASSLITLGSFESDLVSPAGLTIYPSSDTPSMTGWTLGGIDALLVNALCTQSGVRVNAEDGIQWAYQAGAGSDSPLKYISQFASALNIRFTAAGARPQIRKFSINSELAFTFLPPLGEPESKYTPLFLTQYTPLPPLVNPGSRYVPQYVPQSLPPLGRPGWTPQYRLPSNDSNNHRESQRAICEGDCVQKCSRLSSFGSTGVPEDCRREESNCKARCQ